MCKAQLSCALFYWCVGILTCDMYAMCRGGTSNLQGGAIYARDGANVEISACTFQQNEAGWVSAEYEVVLKLCPHKRRFVNCPPIGGAGHPTSREGLFMLMMV